MTGEEFKELRISCNLTQQELANAAQINIRQIQKIEAGEIKLANISLKNGIVLAGILNNYPVKYFAYEETQDIIKAHRDKER